MGKKPVKLSREFTQKELVEATTAVDDSVPEAVTSHRRALGADRRVGGAEHRAGEEGELEEPTVEGLQALPDPPKQSDPYKGA